MENLNISGRIRIYRYLLVKCDPMGAQPVAVSKEEVVQALVGVVAEQDMASWDPRLNGGKWEAMSLNTVKMYLSQYNDVLWFKTTADGGGRDPQKHARGNYFPCTPEGFGNMTDALFQAVVAEWEAYVASKQLECEVLQAA